MADTLAAGRGVARESAVRVLCDESPARVRELEALGVTFDADRHGNLALGLEGGHSARRIVHAGGVRHRAPHHARAVRQGGHARAHPGARAGLRRGALARSTAAASACSRAAATAPSCPLLARATVLATGGMAALWERTTNPAGAIGAGLGLAEAAGAQLADLEFMQFHPTALRTGGARDGFLITEAVRGEGATLLDADGERFVDELAPRDHVALAIEAELARSGRRAVGLDLRHLDLGRFPNIAAALAEVGIDPASDLVPVAPAAHYTMGGVATDLDGRATLRRPLRRRRERLQRPSRRQPAGLQLARRMLRLRPPRGARGMRRAPAAIRPRARPGARPARAPARLHARGALAPRRTPARRRGAPRAVARPVSRSPA